jgi:hypothetical protein
MEYDKIGFLEVSPNNKSMGRLLSLLAAIVGTAVAISGIGLAYIIILKGLEGIGSATTMTAAGLGVFSVGDIMKGWAKKYEQKV